MNLISRFLCISSCLVWIALAQTAVPTTSPSKTESGTQPKAASPVQSSPVSAYLKEAVMSESAGTVHVSANSPRPLEQVLDGLQKKYGWVVNYEDPQYVSHVDLMDTHDASAAQVPAGGSFSVDFPATAPDEEKILRLVVDAYNRSKNPGQFELRRSQQGLFYVIGTGAHDEKGAIATQQVVLDLPVTFPTQERTIADTITLIGQSIAQQTHFEVTLGVMPRSLIAHAPVKLGGTKVPARELVLQSLQAAARPMYWRLLFDPSTKGYFLNIHVVRPA